MREGRLEIKESRKKVTISNLKKICTFEGRDAAFGFRFRCFSLYSAWVPLYLFLPDCGDTNRGGKGDRSRVR